MKIVTTDWRALSLPEQVRHLEVEGSQRQCGAP